VTELNKRVLVHSIHSQVTYTLEKLQAPLELIISLDSHLDTQLGGDHEIYPEEVKLAAERTSVHTVFRRLYGELPLLRDQTGPEQGVTDIIIAIPAVMLETHVEMQRRILGERFGRPGEDPIGFYVSFLKRFLGVEVYTSPPGSLMGLAGTARAAKDWLLDIDVDYMHEMQGECYSPITKGVKLGHLQRAAHVLNFIQRSSPLTITISEAKVDALRNPRSNISGFLDKLRSFGYAVEEKDVLSEDALIEKQIKDCADFYLEVSRGILAEKIRANPEFGLEELGAVEAPAAKEFFRKRGYKV